MCQFEIKDCTHLILRVCSHEVSMFEKAKMEALRNISLTDVLIEASCTNDKNDKHKWHTSKGVLSVTGKKFFNWNTQTGGGGAIDLSIHLFDFDFKTTIKWLEDRFWIDSQPVKLLTPENQRPFKPPPRENNKLPQVIQYLHEVRCIPRDLLNKLISDGLLYGDRKGNAVFLLLGKGRKVVGAELRGTYQRRWLGMAKGSRKDLGAFYVKSPNPKLAVICESAIDAISLFAILNDGMVISTAGANSNPVWLTEFLAKTDYEIFCGFDSDKTGDYFADRMIHRHPRIRRLRPHQHDWNEVLKSRTSSASNPLPTD